MYQNNSNNPYSYNSYKMGNTPDFEQQPYQSYPCPYAIPPYPFVPNQYNYRSTPFYAEPLPDYGYLDLEDYGPDPFAIDIHEAAMQNSTFRTALWTGNHLQLTLMSLNVGEDIGFEVHEDRDQLIGIEHGTGIVLMGESRERLDFQANVGEGYLFIVPAGTTHNLINTGNTPLKLFSVYAPPQHPFGTVHETKEDAMADKKYD